jgi:thiol:disulfide interchange protein DsbD
MGWLIRLLVLLWSLVAVVPVVSGAPAPQTTVRLLLSHETARPGETITAALELSSAPKWHTYWRNSGDSGFPTTIQWDLPAGLSAEPIQWPVPHKAVLIDFASYVYEGTEYLLIPIMISPDAKPGAVQLKGRVDWLECEKSCHPRKTNVAATLTIGPEWKLSANAAFIDKARQRLPKETAPFAVTAQWERGTNAATRTLVIEWATNEASNQPDFYAFESEQYTVAASTVVEASGPKVRLKKTVSLVEETNGWPRKIAGLVINDTTAKEPVGYQVSLELPTDAAPNGAPTSQSASAVQIGGSPVAKSLWAVLGIAFLGGLILNIMPCVLPVIALKILSFVNQSGTESGRARRLGIIYALGVLTSFAVLAGLIIAVKQSGQVASWGMQYQNPVFLVVMVTLVTLISLNLFGVFEITLGGSAMGAASELASKEGRAGAFFNGVLATVLGTSCTAPFLAFAIGYAFGQPALVTLLVFLMMGVGLAFPYVLLTWNPALLRLLPKPGAWMEKFKVAMGFPMLATAIWLYGVAVSAHFGSTGAFWLALFLLLVAVAAWIFGAFIQRGRKLKGFAALISLGALAFAVGFVLENKLSWRSPNYAQTSERSVANNSGIEWQKWSHEAVAKTRAEGRPVLVDFTATWCPNCQFNKATSIEIEAVEKKLKEINGVAMIADFTRKDPVIAEELKRFERYAVPLVLVYPAGPAQPPMVLPEILTPDIVLGALDRAANAARLSGQSKELSARTQ